MTQICNPTKKCNYLDFAELAYFFFLFGTVFTILGPVIHYICYGLSLVSMVISQFLEKSHIFKKPTGVARTIFILFFVFFVLEAFPNAINAPSFYVWGKGSSVFLETILYTYMAFCLFDTDEKRKKLLITFAVANAILALVICFRPLFQLWFHNATLLKILNFNASLDNGNCFGSYATLLLPIFLICANFFCGNALLGAILTCIAICATICSLSVGYWGANFVCFVSFIILTISKKLLNTKFFFTLLIITILSGCALFVASPPEFKLKLKEEISQAAALFTERTGNTALDLDKFTTHRYGIWMLSIDMIRDKPLVGWGYDNFLGKSKDFYDNHKDKLTFENYGWYEIGESFYHPHNTFLSVAVAGGLPSLFVFLVFSLTVTYVAFKTYFTGKSRLSVIFALLMVISIATQAGAGLTSDLFAARRDMGVIFWAFLGVFLALLQDNATDSK